MWMVAPASGYFGWYLCMWVYDHVCERMQACLQVYSLCALQVPVWDHEYKREHVSAWACCEHLCGVCVYRSVPWYPLICLGLENKPMVGVRGRSCREELAQPSGM